MDNQVIYDLVKEVRDEQKDMLESITRHTTKFAEHLISDQKMSDDIAHLKEAIIHNNSILDKLTETVIKHESRSTTLEAVVIGTPEQPGLVPRVEKLEEPDRVREYLRKKYLKWSAVMAVTISIAGGLSKIFGWW